MYSFSNVLSEGYFVISVAHSYYLEPKLEPFVKSKSGNDSAKT